MGGFFSNAYGQLGTTTFGGAVCPEIGRGLNQLATRPESATVGRLEQVYEVARRHRKERTRFECRLMFLDRRWRRFPRTYLCRFGFKFSVRISRNKWLACTPSSFAASV